MKICTYPDCTCPFDMAADNRCLLGHPSVRDAFIRFLKDAHAFDEWKSAVGGEKTATEILDSIDAGRAAVDALVEDGWYLHHRDAAVSVEWAVVDKQWKAVLSDAGWVA